MPAGSIVLDLLLKTGSFETDTQRSAKALRQFQKEADAVGKAIGLSLAGIAVAAAATATASAKAALEAIDAFNDLKDATGASIENISAIDRVARETGVGFDTVSTALVKLNQALLAAKPDTPTADALARIGLSAKELRAQDPAEALRQVAVALSQFSDDGAKGRLVQELFGKSLREVAPLLNDLAEKTKLTATTSTDAAQEIEKFRKELFRLEANSQDTARALTGDGVKGINALVAAAREGRFDIVAFHKDLAKLAGTALSLGIVDFRDRPNTNYGNEGRNVSNRNEDYSNEGRSKRSVGDPRDPTKKARPAKPYQDPDAQVKAYEENQKELTRAQIDAVQASEAFFNQQVAETEAIRQQIAALGDEAATYGLSAREADAYAAAKLRAEAASKRLLAQQREDRNIGDSAARELREQANALDELAAKKDAFGARREVVDELKRLQAEADAINQSIADDLGNAFGDFITGTKSAKHAFTDFANSVINEMARMYAKKLATSIVTGGGASDWLSALIGAVGGGGYSYQGSTLPNSLRGGAATGTNFVERDMLTILHEGEAVVPKAYNPAAGGAVGGEVIVQVITPPGAPVQQEQSEVGGKRFVKVIVGEVARDMGRGGKTRQATREAVGPRLRRG